MQLFHKRTAATAVCIAVTAISALSQSPSEEFNKFREEIFAGFSDFKSRILDHYADFLDGEWHESESVTMETELLPKPVTIPQLPETQIADEEEYVLLPPVEQNTDVLLGLDKIPETISRLGKKLNFFKPKSKTNYELAAEKIPDPDFAFGPYPDQIPLLDPDEIRTDGTDDSKGHVFDFYGIRTRMPDYDLKIVRDISDYRTRSGENWKLLDGQSNAREAARHLFGIAQDMGLNGYLTYRLTEHYVKSKFPDANLMSRLSTVHYLISQMGYDARLGTLYNGFPVIMLPFDQTMVYGLGRTKPEGSTRTYTVLPPLGYTGKDIDDILKVGNAVSSAYIPVKNSGKTSDLRLTGLNLPMKGKPFEISDGNLTIRGEVNENLMAMLYRYPQMPMGDFASSWLDNDLRKDILLQVKMQLMDLSDKDAVDRLMSLFHYGFEYASDQEFHGFEKPYFLEENLYYDKNDCEDRAMFFSYLVWNALDLPCKLIQFSDHESTAVAPGSDVAGCYYNIDGMKYFSADPTYIGSHFGMMGEKYKRESPKVDKSYK